MEPNICFLNSPRCIRHICSQIDSYFLFFSKFCSRVIILNFIERKYRSSIHHFKNQDVSLRGITKLSTNYCTNKFNTKLSNCYVYPLGKKVTLYIPPYILVETSLSRLIVLLNESHKKTTNTIEQYFGVWKRIFPIKV